MAIRSQCNFLFFMLLFLMLLSVTVSARPTGISCGVSAPSTTSESERAAFYFAPWTDRSRAPFAALHLSELSLFTSSNSAGPPRSTPWAVSPTAAWTIGGPATTRSVDPLRPPVMRSSQTIISTRISAINRWGPLTGTILYWCDVFQFPSSYYIDHIDPPGVGRESIQSGETWGSKSGSDGEDTGKKHLFWFIKLTRCLTNITLDIGELNAARNMYNDI